MTKAERRGETDDAYRDLASHLEQEKQVDCVLRMIDYLIVEGAEMKLGFFVFLLRLARVELLRQQAPT
jgi:hypothetical protein